MKFFKNHKRAGISLVEVLFATAIIGFVGISVLGLQQALLRTTSEASSLLLHMRLMNNFAVENQKDILEQKDPPSKKVAEETDAELIYRGKQLPKTGIFKELKGLKLASFGVSWIDVVGPRQEHLTYMRYRPEENGEKQ